MAFDAATFDVVYNATYGIISSRTHGFDDLDYIDGSFVAEVYEEVFVGREVTDPGTLIDPMDILDSVFDDVADEAKCNIHVTLADIASEASAWGDDWDD